MGIQDFFSLLYSSITSDSRIASPIRFLIRKMANYIIPFTYKYIQKHNYSALIHEDIIVSLTSFPARIDNLWIVIETLLRQTIRPYKIILWLSKEQFSTSKVPDTLKELIKYGLDIKLVENDYKSHKKYYYTFKQYPNKKIVLVDDDIIYHATLIENLLSTYVRYDKKVVVGTYGYTISRDSKGKPLSYNKWKMLDDFSDNHNLFLGTGGGSLFNPNLLFNDVCDIELATRLTPLADDIWLNAMIKLANVKLVINKPRIILPVVNNNNKTLSSQNVSLNLNDVQIKNINEYYNERFKTDVF